MKVGFEGNMILSLIRRLRFEYVRKAYQKHRCRNMHLTLRSEDGDLITCSFFVGETDKGVGLALDVMDEDTFLAQERTVIPTRGRYRLHRVVPILSISL